MRRLTVTAIGLWLIFTGTSGVLSAQEEITPLHVNPVLRLHKASMPLRDGKLLLGLPFIEDFSDGKWYTDPQRWSDGMAYVNNDYPLRQPTIGVATLDALDAWGAVYTTATSFPFPADTLTSQPIDLSASMLSDSVIFSFHYQPAGIGNAPERDDSLLLEFWSEAQQSWLHMWSDRGRTYDAFLATYGKPFPIVILPVDSSLFFSPGFRFRFRNYASITDASLPDWGGNVDMWHLDYIVLAPGRSVFDTLINNDVAFRDYPKPLLKNYFSMPWNQYLANAAGEMMVDSVAIPYSAYYYGLSTAINQSYAVNSLTGGTHYDPGFYSYGNLPMPSHTTVIPAPGTGFNTYQFAAPSAPYADFEIVAALSPFSVSEAIATNDTVRFYQKFYNYFAYDDGTPEAGYGLSSSNPNARMNVALRFDLNVADTLRAVQMFFNQTKDLANQEFFNLMVWENDNGSPGDTLYTAENLMPQFIEGLNQYHTYILDRPVPVSGSVFVGWQQKSGVMLNLGFDRNRNASSRLKYNIGNGWNASQFSGALMIRPVLGATPVPYIHVPVISEARALRLFPNPASDRLGVTWEDPSEQMPVLLMFYSLQGKLLKTCVTDTYTDVTDLSPGMYVVKVSDVDSGTVLATEKIILTR